MHREQWNWRKSAVIVLGLALNAAMPVQSATEIDRTQLEKRLGAVSILLESSSASRQIDASGDAPQDVRPILQRHGPTAGAVQCRPHDDG